MSNFRVDVYTNPHKELREGLFLLALEAAFATQHDERAQVVAKARVVLNKLAQHARSENTYLHPIVRPKIVQHVSALDHAHDDLEENMEQLSKATELLAQESGDNYPASLKDFTHVLHKLIGLNLLHMEQEESLLPLYWQYCEPYELFAVMLAFKSNEEPEAFPFVMGLAQQHLSQDELIQSFAVIQERLGEDIFQRACHAATTLLSEHLLSNIQNGVRR